MPACGMLMASGCFADDPKWGLGSLRQFCKGRREAEPQGRVGARVRAAEEGREPVGWAGRAVS